MTDRFWLVLSASLFVAAVVWALGGPTESGSPLFASAATSEEKPKKSSGPPPLVVDKNAPLLLDDPPEEDPFEGAKGPMADNTACYHCHVNYKEEPLALEHAKANVGCVKCHGESLDHRNDENNITPPEVMFPAAKIGKFCAECHEEHDAPAREVVARWQERCPQKTDPTKILCTDCHGRHRLTHRTVRWNKETGKLIDEKQRQPAPKAPEQPKKKPQP